MTEEYIRWGRRGWHIKGNRDYTVCALFIPDIRWVTDNVDDTHGHRCPTCFPQKPQRQLAVRSGDPKLWQNRPGAPSGSTNPTSSRIMQPTQTPNPDLKAVRLEPLLRELELLRNDSHLQLMCGEMNADEKRSVKAVISHLHRFVLEQTFEPTIPVLTQILPR